MAVLVTAEVPGQTREGYDGMLAALGPAIRATRGFIAHFMVPTDNGVRVMELWETPEDANRFFAEVVHPNLPDGVKPKRSVQQLHALVRS